MINDFGSLDKHNECLKKSGILIYSFRINGFTYRFPLMDVDQVEIFLKYLKNKSDSGEKLLKFLFVLYLKRCLNYFCVPLMLLRLLQFLL